MATDVMAAAILLKETFKKYAGTDKDKDTMSKKEFAEFLREDIGDIDTTKESDEFFSQLDEDGDGVLQFEEFAMLLFAFCEIYEGILKSS
ncbi:protein S100-G-like [Parambassis ranga]|uniref:Protein S100-G-like n=1 Tax=Parambassis ranga TaxID=210632 RepID=A0A6P7JYZ5_9TELE|nr:protein S100-G-like [Parambassis ranga]